jgi:predicted ribosome-associated RNA-binding protein Tma20
MKKNLWLFGILAALLTLTYFFQEVREREAVEDKRKQERVLKTEIKSLGWSGVVAEKKDQRWWMNKILLSHNLFKQLEKKLSEVSQLKEVPEINAKFFTDPFTITVNGEEWMFGDMTLDGQGFYLKVGQQGMIAHVDGESRELTQEGTSIEEVKRDEIRSLLAQEVKEIQLFRHYVKLPLEQMTVEAEGMQKFTLDLVKNQTFPSTIQGIAVLDKLQQKVVTLITQMTVKEEITPGKFYKKLASITLSAKDDSLVWEMWLRSKENGDAVVVDAKNQRAFLMIGGSLKIFFVRIQDYWDKKVIPAAAFKPFDQLTVSFTQGAKSAKVIVLNKEPLNFESKEAKVKTATMESLIKLLFNLAEYDQAERVSQLATTERQQYLSEENLRIEIMNQDLVLKRKAEELIVVNLTQGFKAHFNMLDEKFRGRFEDVLESKK